MQKMSLKYSLESILFEDEHHDNCSICGRHFINDETTHLGYDSNHKLVYVGNCCRNFIKSTIVRHVYFPRDYTKPTKETILWRYLNLSKFITLLKDSSLFFSRADLFSDPFEGAKGIYTNEEKWDSFYKDFVKKAICNPPDGVKMPYNTESQIETEASRLLNDIKNFGKNSRTKTFINCWHENQFESEAMWKLYCPDLSQGLAIKTTYGKLFNELNQKEHIEIGRVQYIDYTKQMLGINGAFWYKRKSFEHEKEVRAIIHRFHNTNDTLGINITISLENLISAIHISPMAPHWFVEMVKDVSRKYGLSKPILQSQMTVKPFY
ncbi:MAG: hypothetical protein SPL19_09590 [Fibrobacter sp.]|nr:hypothetical protein [Fibrobacter sp.]MDY6370339.1 hypothetical protein [Fibrobacter sp.]MDY6390598.1 hypothetical protein [Fibrobacter sp.]